LRYPSLSCRFSIVLDHEIVEKYDEFEGHANIVYDYELEADGAAPIDPMIEVRNLQKKCVLHMDLYPNKEEFTPQKYTYSKEAHGSYVNEK